MYKNWMTSEVKLEITASIARVVVRAAAPREGAGLSGDALKALAEDAGVAILAGLAKAGIGQQPGAGSVIVYGPQGCGKTRHSEALAAHYGVSKVVDDWMPGDPVEPGALHLSQVEVPGAVAYESLQALLNLCDTCRGAREIRHPYSVVERMPCPICTSAQS